LGKIEEDRFNKTYESFIGNRDAELKIRNEEIFTKFSVYGLLQNIAGATYTNTTFIADDNSGKLKNISTLLLKCEINKNSFSFATYYI
jgi:hypothetical protein